MQQKIKRNITRIRKGKLGTKRIRRSNACNFLILFRKKMGNITHLSLYSNYIFKWRSRYVLRWMTWFGDSRSNWKSNKFHERSCLYEPDIYDSCWRRNEWMLTSPDCHSNKFKPAITQPSALLTKYSVILRSTHINNSSCISAMLGNGYSTERRFFNFFFQTVSLLLPALNTTAATYTYSIALASLRVALFFLTLIWIRVYKKYNIVRDAYVDRYICNITADLVTVDQRLKKQFITDNCPWICCLLNAAAAGIVEMALIPASDLSKSVLTKTIILAVRQLAPIGPCAPYILNYCLGRTIVLISLWI